MNFIPFLFIFSPIQFIVNSTPCHQIHRHFRRIFPIWRPSIYASKEVGWLSIGVYELPICTSIKWIPYKGKKMITKSWGCKMTVQIKWKMDDSRMEDSSNLLAVFQWPNVKIWKGKSNFLSCGSTFAHPSTCGESSKLRCVPSLYPLSFFLRTQPFIIYQRKTWISWFFPQWIT